VVAGFELGTGVSVAAISPEPPAARLEGADNCREKSLVMVATVEACFVESATLCAVTVRFAGEGRICGAV
jgi:hypothetical protein